MRPFAQIAEADHDRRYHHRGTCFSLAVAEGDDKRQLVKFLRPMIDHTLSNMRDHVQALQESQSQLGMGHADDVEMDAAGRLLIPPALRQYAGLDRQIVLVGQGNKFEIWDEARWNEQTAAATTFSNGGLPPELEGFSL